MSVRTADTGIAFLPARTRGRAVQGLFARMQSAVGWVAELPRRRAVLNELEALSDHELADIGLARADVPRVFDAEFGRRRG